MSFGLQWRPGKQKRKQADPVVISQGPATPAIERATPVYDPMVAAFPQFYQAAPEPPKRKRGRPRK